MGTADAHEQTVASGLGNLRWYDRSILATVFREDIWRHGVERVSEMGNIMHVAGRTTIQWHS
jgi:hypothetical protein